LVYEADSDSRANRQPSALAYALERLHSGQADQLVVSRLDHLARTRAELADLLESIAQSNGGLVVLDRDLDTASLPDPVAPDEPLSPVSRLPGPRTRLPEAADNRAVDAHIASMLDDGLSRRAIAAALNDEPVPAPQGANWSYSGVQAALRRRQHAGMERSNA